MSDRYQREIDDLLRGLDWKPRREPLSRRISRRLRPYTDAARHALIAYLRRPPSEQFMIAAFLLVIMSFVLGYFTPLAAYLSALAILCFILALGLAVAGRRSPGYQKRWRGRLLDEPRGPTIWRHLRDWFRRRPPYR